MSQPTILAIDPGNTESAFVVVDIASRRALDFGKIPNEDLDYRLWIPGPHGINGDICAIEMIASYGMAVGADVFETCVWIGRFVTAIERGAGATPALVKRHPVKMHHCHSTKAKDSNITQALVDRFAPGVRNRGKGTKAEPGWFYGFRADIWQAYALAVYVADTAPSDWPAAHARGEAATAAGHPLHQEPLPMTHTQTVRDHGGPDPLSRRPQ